MTSNRHKPPNILFFLPDQHRADWLGLNRSLPLRTPNLDNLASEGVHFTRAYCPSPLCAPSRACLASGRSYERCGVLNNNQDYPLDQPTYYQRLQDAGYRVAGVGKFDLHKSTLDWNLDGSLLLKEWGFTDGIDNEGKLDGSRSYRSAGEPKGPYLRHLADKKLADAYETEHRDRRRHRDAYTTCLPDESYCDNWLSDNGLRILKNLPTDRPWHFVVNFTGPHCPMDVTQSMRSEWEEIVFPGPHSDAPGNDREYTNEDHQRNRQNYAAMIENIDRQVGRYLDLVEERGETDNTVVVYSSDHGEMLGDHGRWGKVIWYEESVGIPLIVKGPGIQKGKSDRTLVLLPDLAATFLDYAGAHALSNCDALTLRPVLEGDGSALREYVYTALVPPDSNAAWHTIIGERYKMVETHRGRQLFDLDEDPQENTNSAAKHPDLVDELTRHFPKGYKQQE